MGLPSTLTTSKNHVRPPIDTGGSFFMGRDVGHVRWMKSRKRFYIDLWHEGKRHHIYSFQGVSFKQRDYAGDVLTPVSYTHLTLPTN